MKHDLDAQITRMSTKGQIVIPEAVRNDLGLRAGSTLVVYSRRDADAILLKKLEFPDPVRAFEEMVRWGRAHAKAKGFDTSESKIVKVQHKRRREK